jgi:hypothetical protein
MRPPFARSHPGAYAAYTVELERDCEGWEGFNTFWWESPTQSTSISISTNPSVAFASDMGHRNMVMCTVLNVSSERSGCEADSLLVDPTEAHSSHYSTRYLCPHARGQEQPSEAGK